MNIIYITGILSLIVQIITGIVDYYVLSLDTPHELHLLKQLLLTEFIVQIVEGTFYVWMVVNFTTISNITRFRYYDWAITTPTMLITYSLFLIYLKNKQDKKEPKDMIELIAWFALVFSLIGFLWRFIFMMSEVNVSFIRLTLETIIIVLLSLRVLGYI